MNLKAIIPSGVTEITVNGLHQWDYGRKLEIHKTNLLALVEVHFACAGMNEAVVRSCSVTNGVAVAAIPDRCLEQTAPITAWVHELDADSGATTAKINLTVEPRVRPCPNQDIPEDISDRYTEAIGAMNEAVENLVKNNVTVARAIADENGNKILDTYATLAEVQNAVQVVHGKVLNTDILAKVKELTSGSSIGVHQFALGGSGYEKDDDGNCVNLPNNSCATGRATVLIRWSVSTVILWGFTGQPIYYNSLYSSGDWTGWRTIIDSSNVGKQSVRNAQYVQVSLNLVISNDSDFDDFNADMTYYQNGERKNLDLGNFGFQERKSYTITTDLGSSLSISNDKHDLKYDDVDSPLSAKSYRGAEGAYNNRTRFIVTGGGIGTLYMKHPTWTT